MRSVTVNISGTSKVFANGVALSLPRCAFLKFNEELYRYSSISLSWSDLVPRGLCRESGGACCDSASIARDAAQRRVFMNVFAL